jgi:hypothetical protein
LNHARAAFPTQLNPALPTADGSVARDGTRGSAQRTFTNGGDPIEKTDNRPRARTFRSARLRARAMWLTPRQQSWLTIDLLQDRTGSAH